MTQASLWAVTRGPTAQSTASLVNEELSRQSTLQGRARGGGRGPHGTLLDGINNQGSAIGSLFSASGQSHGFLYRDGNFTPLDPPRATFSRPAAINAKGEVVGDYQ